MLIIWILGILVIGSVGAYYLGQQDNRIDIVDLFWTLFMGAIFWPIILGFGLIVAPFAIPFILGQQKKNKEKKTK
jgi:hypothetical protein